MRSTIIFVLFVALSTAAWLLPRQVSAQEVTVGYQRFYDDLSPYGTWVEYPNYGYVWIPNGVPGFSPYATAGHWVLTDDGWTWASDYPWGWAAFHYGRWDYDNSYGWFWVPGDEWGPAWVSWRRSRGYYGWAPLRPGISIDIAVGREYHESNERWVFVRDRDFTRSDIGGRYVNRNRNVTIINNSTVIVNTRRDERHNVTYIAGPERNDVQRVTRTRVQSVAIRETDQPGQHLSHGEMQLYRPQVQKGSGSAQSPAPSKVMKLADVKPASERVNASRQEQPRTVNPPPKIQTQPARQSPLSENKGLRQQPRTANPPSKIQQQPARQSPLSETKEVRQQPRSANLARRNQPPQPGNVHLSKQMARTQQPRKTAPPRQNIRVQPPHPNPPERKER